MKVLVVGQGGREHVLVWKLAQSPKVDQVFCAPGNAGTERDAANVDVKADDVERLARFAEEEGVDLTVVGPEVPLTAGLVDLFEEKGLTVFGPNRAAAELEGSKVFSKEIMRLANGPKIAMGRRLPGHEQLWLVCEKRTGGEQRYYLSNLRADVKPPAPARMIKGRGACEQAHQQMKQELGLDHFEGRSWLGLHHHALLVMIGYCFLQWLRLKGKKGAHAPARRPSRACPRSSEPSDG